MDVDVLTGRITDFSSEYHMGFGGYIHDDDLYDRD